MTILDDSPKTLIHEIKIVSMDFAAELDDNSTTTQQQSHHLPDLVSARWDLYKNVTLVTSSSIQRLLTYCLLLLFETG